MSLFRFFSLFIIFKSSFKDFGLCTKILLTITNVASNTGRAKSIREVDILASDIKARSAIIKPYTDLPEEPDIIFSGGIANIKNARSEPLMAMDVTAVKSEDILIATMKRRVNITPE